MSEALKLAELWKGRADDAGLLSRAVLSEAEALKRSIDKNMNNSSASPSTDAHTVALHAFVAARNKAEIRCEWTARKGQRGVYDCPVCGCWTANLTRYKYDVCSRKDRRKGQGDRRQR